MVICNTTFITNPLNMFKTPLVITVVYLNVYWHDKNTLYMLDTLFVVIQNKRM